MLALLEMEQDNNTVAFDRSQKAFLAEAIKDGGFSSKHIVDSG